MQHIEIPPLCLQPIAENAVLHGIALREEGGELSIRAEMRNESLLLSVEDDGSGPGASSHTGTGTAMVDLKARVAPYGRIRTRISPLSTIASERPGTRKPASASRYGKAIRCASLIPQKSIA